MDEPAVIQNRVNLYTQFRGTPLGLLFKDVDRLLGRPMFARSNYHSSTCYWMSQGDVLARDILRFYRTLNTEQRAQMLDVVEAVKTKNESMLQSSPQCDGIRAGIEAMDQFVPLLLQVPPCPPDDWQDVAIDMH